MLACLTSTRKVVDVARMEANGWKRLKDGVTMDPGAPIDITPEDDNPELQIRKLTGPRKGSRLAAAKGTPIAVQGEKCLHVVTRKGQKLP